MAVAEVNCAPVSCMPSPESPANRIVTLCRGRLGFVVVVCVVMRSSSQRSERTNTPDGRDCKGRRREGASQRPTATLKMVLRLAGSPKDRFEKDA